MPVTRGGKYYKTQAAYERSKKSGGGGGSQPTQPTSPTAARLKREGRAPTRSEYLQIIREKYGEAKVQEQIASAQSRSLEIRGAVYNPETKTYEAKYKPLTKEQTKAGLRYTVRPAEREVLAEGQASRIERTLTNPRNPVERKRAEELRKLAKSESQTEKARIARGILGSVESRTAGTVILEARRRYGDEFGRVSPQAIKATALRSPSLRAIEKQALVPNQPPVMKSTWDKIVDKYNAAESFVSPYIKKISPDIKPFSEAKGVEYLWEQKKASALLKVSPVKIAYQTFYPVGKGKEIYWGVRGWYQDIRENPILHGALFVASAGISVVSTKGAQVGSKAMHWLKTKPGMAKALYYVKHTKDIPKTAPYYAKFLKAAGPTIPAIKTASKTLVTVGGVGLMGSYVISSGKEIEAQPTEEAKYEMAGAKLGRAATIGLGGYAGTHLITKGIPNIKATLKGGLFKQKVPIEKLAPKEVLAGKVRYAVARPDEQYRLAVAGKLKSGQVIWQFPGEKPGTRLYHTTPGGFMQLPKTKLKMVKTVDFTTGKVKRSLKFVKEPVEIAAGPSYGGSVKSAFYSTTPASISFTRLPKTKIEPFGLDFWPSGGAVKKPEIYGIEFLGKKENLLGLGQYKKAEQFMTTKAKPGFAYVTGTKTEFELMSPAYGKWGPTKLALESIPAQTFYKGMVIPVAKVRAVAKPDIRLLGPGLGVEYPKAKFGEPDIVLFTKKKAVDVTKGKLTYFGVGKGKVSKPLATKEGGEFLKKLVKEEGEELLKPSVGYAVTPYSFAAAESLTGLAGSSKSSGFVPSGSFIKSSYSVPKSKVVPYGLQPRPVHTPSAVVLPPYVKPPGSSDTNRPPSYPSLSPPSYPSLSPPSYPSISPPSTPYISRPPSIPSIKPPKRPPKEPLWFRKKKPDVFKGSVRGFDVFVRQKGKFTKVSKSVLPKGAALGLGIKLTDVGTAATFKLKPSGLIPKGFGGSFLPKKKLKQRYYSPKGQSLTFIEKRKYRISTPGEILGLRRAKRSKKGRSLF